MRETTKSRKKNKYKHDFETLLPFIVKLYSIFFLNNFKAKTYQLEKKLKKPI